MAVIVIIITLQIATAVAKKHQSSSAESIENLLYYKDCKHKQKDPPPAPPPLPEPLVQRESDCACPRMCISMCCDCNNFQQSFVGRQMQPLQSQNSMIEPMQSPMLPPQRAPPFNVQPQVMQRGRKKKLKPKMGMESPMLQPPIGGRRDFGFTRQNIKSLISQDEDIKKILKDLVRVTMRKADLVDVVKKTRDQEQAQAMETRSKQVVIGSEEDDDE